MGHGTIVVGSAKSIPISVKIQKTRPVAGYSLEQAAIFGNWQARRWLLQLLPEPLNVRWLGQNPIGVGEEFLGWYCGPVLPPYRLKQSISDIGLSCISISPQRDHSSVSERSSEMVLVRNSSAPNHSGART